MMAAFVASGAALKRAAPAEAEGGLCEVAVFNSSSLRGRGESRRRVGISTTMVAAPERREISAAASALPVPSATSLGRVSLPATPKAEQMVGTLLVKCVDRTGVVAALGQLLFGLGCNIVESDQFTDRYVNGENDDEAWYFQRIRFDYTAMHAGAGNCDPVLKAAMGQLAERYDMWWRVSYHTAVQNVAVLVSKADHCLLDLLIRMQAGELPCQIPVIVSNHELLRPHAERFGVPFHRIDWTQGKEAAEKELRALMVKYEIDTIVLARYMQILSREFCDDYDGRVINIHHSFLPAFEGARPYHRAHSRGVKIIGATAHYATSELDCGPIIEQDVRRISHKDDVADMIRKGRDLERLVLSRAVRWHLLDQIITHGNKTVVFGD
mmetsp:Transcript_10596/g.28233  ORF Transcript_10596/g.28233 Transcript_10596/m.28233 type:complete len:382 (+) Transcript_10596:13-1158(+)